MQVPVCCPCCNLTCETIQHSLWFCKSLSEHLLPAVESVAWSISFLSDLDSAVPSPVASRRAAELPRWTRPAEGWLKLNVDASLRVDSCLVGLGVVVRNSNGDFMAGLSRKLVGSVSIEIAEAFAILNGLHLTIESGFSRIQVESDALNVINYLIRRCPPKSKVGLIIIDILSLYDRACVSFSFVPRSANFVAYSLARNSFSMFLFGWRMPLFGWIRVFCLISSVSLCSILF
ncbi:hypothetical protein ACOSP7_011189 [Xanthoceras sorbifolium]